MVHSQAADHGRAEAPSGTSGGAHVALALVLALTYGCGARSGLGDAAVDEVGAGGSTSSTSASSPVGPGPTGTGGEGTGGPAASTGAGGGGEGGGDGWQGAQLVAAGAYHTCAVPFGRELSCWGSNREGQLGVDGDDLLPPTRVDLPVQGEVVALAAGFRHTCAAAQPDFTAAPRLFCWGENLMGQLGVVTDAAIVRTPIEVPIPWGDATAIVSLAAGETHTCAALNDGRTFCWGDNRQGQLGVPVADTPSPPVEVLSGSLAVIAAGDFHTCAAIDTRTLCWGQGFFGQLGFGGTEDRRSPVEVEAGVAFRLVASRGFFNLAVPYFPTEGASLFGWGDDAGGVLGGDGMQTIPVTLPAEVSIDTLAPGLSHACIAQWDPAERRSRVACWGDNGAGQLGDGTRAARVEPRWIDGDLEARGLASGTQHTCAFDAEGVLFCWGSNAWGQCGSPTREDVLVPLAVTMP